MSLDQFLAENMLSREAFAKMVGVHPTTIYRVLAGATIPKRRNLEKILKLTRGHVTVAELLGRQVL
jgi:predicted transcriptional regulator